MSTQAKVLSAALSAVVLLSVALASTSISADTANDTAAVKRATAEFYASLNALFTGKMAPMKAVWSHADDVTYMGPAGGMQVGWKQVQAQWQTQADLKLGGKIEPTDVHMFVGDKLAVVHCYERGENEGAEGQTVQVSIRATNVFRREQGEWKMIGHHTDPLPFLANEEAAAPKK